MSAPSSVENTNTQLECPVCGTQQQETDPDKCFCCDWVLNSPLSFAPNAATQYNKELAAQKEYILQRDEDRWHKANSEHSSQAYAEYLEQCGEKHYEERARILQTFLEQGAVEFLTKKKSERASKYEDRINQLGPVRVGTVTILKRDEELGVCKFEVHWDAKLDRFRPPVTTVSAVVPDMDIGALRTNRRKNKIPLLAEYKVANRKLFVENLSIVLPSRDLEISNPVNKLTRFKVLKGHQVAVHKMAAANDKTHYLLSGDTKGVIILRDIWDDKRDEVLNVHSGSQIAALAMAPDEQSFVSADKNGAVYWWTRGKSGAKHKDFRRMAKKLHKKPVTALRFSSDNRFLALGHEDGALSIYNLDTQAVRTISDAHSMEIRCIDFSMDDRFLATGSKDHLIRMWDSETGEDYETLTSHKGEVWSLFFSKKHNLLASAGGWDCTIFVWKLGDIEDGEIDPIEGQGKHHQDVLAVAFTHDSTTVVSAGVEGVIKLWDVDNMKKGERFVEKDHEYSIRNAIFLDGGNILATSGSSRTIQLWKTEHLLPYQFEDPS